MYLLSLSPTTVFLHHRQLIEQVLCGSLCDNAGGAIAREEPFANQPGSCMEMGGTGGLPAPIVVACRAPLMLLCMGLVLTGLENSLFDMPVS